MNEAMPAAKGRAPDADLPGRDVRAGGLLALGIRAMVVLATSWLAPAAVAIGAIAAFWGLPTR